MTNTYVLLTDFDAWDKDLYVKWIQYDFNPQYSENFITALNALCSNSNSVVYFPVV